MRNLVTTIQSLPKVEFHIHLEGCIDEELIARWHGDEKAALINEKLRRYRCSGVKGFSEFVKIFRELCSCLRTMNDLSELLLHVLKRQELQKVIRTEITFTASYYQATYGWDIVEQVRCLSQVLEHWNARGLSQAAVLLDIADDATPELVDATISCAEIFSGHGVVGLNVSTDEKRSDIWRFLGPLRRATRKGIPISIHLGEFLPAAECLELIKKIRPRRIGHGARLADSTQTLAYLARERIAVELCLTSDLSSGSISEVAKFPVRTFLAHGVRVSINTDDPAVFGVSILDEYRKYIDAGLLTLNELELINQEALTSSFC